MRKGIYERYGNKVNRMGYNVPIYVGNAVPVRLAEQMGRSMVLALSGGQSETESNDRRSITYCAVPVQLRLAIETRKGHKNKTDTNGAAKKGGAKSKRDVKPRRHKSVKARYVKHG